MIYIASDHRGYELKQKLIEYFKQHEIPFEDCGPFEENPTDDYPDYVIPAMQKLQSDLRHGKGVVICKNGVGVCMLANKFKGIRCGISWNTKHAKSSREDDDTNVLSLPINYISEEQALDIVKEWLLTPFSMEKRHIRRLKKVEGII